MPSLHTQPCKLSRCESKRITSRLGVGNENYSGFDGVGLGPEPSNFKMET